jgi:hypothetical protein
MKSVYSAVRTGPLNTAVCAPSLKAIATTVTATPAANVAAVAVAVVSVAFK